MSRYLGAFGLSLAWCWPRAGITPAPAAERWATDQFFRVEAEPVDKGNRTVISGYVYNLHYSNAKVRLETDTLDAGGKVIGTTTGYVDSVVPLRGRTYFAYPVRTVGASYKTYVIWYDWIDQNPGDFVRFKPVKRRALLGLALTPLLPLLPGLPRPAGAQTITAETAPQYFRLESAPRQGQEGAGHHLGLHLQHARQGQCPAAPADRDAGRLRQARRHPDRLRGRGHPHLQPRLLRDPGEPAGRRATASRIHSGDWTRLGGL